MAPERFTVDERIRDWFAYPAGIEERCEEAHALPRPHYEEVPPDSENWVHSGWDLEFAQVVFYRRIDGELAVYQVGIAKAFLLDAPRDERWTLIWREVEQGFKRLGPPPKNRGVVH